MSSHWEIASPHIRRVLFRNASGAAQARVQVPLPGVARYTLTSVTAGAALGHVGAPELRAGLDLAFGDDPVVIIELRLTK
jgi:hypothetical protein